MQRHRFDPVSAIAGMLFVAAGVSAVIDGDEWTFVRGGRLWALLLFLGGIAVLTTTFRTERPKSSAAADTVPTATARARHDHPVTDPITDAEVAIEELAAEFPARSEVQDAVNLDEPPNDDHV